MEKPWETGRKVAAWRRLTLRRADGRVYLDRWGFGTRGGSVYLHRMEAPDPGLDLHDHPWTFVSVVIRGGYTEERAATRTAPELAALAELFPETCTRGVREHRARFSVRVFRLDECHRIVALDRAPTWTLVLCGPVRRKWGFYLPGSGGYLPEKTYDETVRVERRDLWAEGGYVESLLAAEEEG